LSSGVRRAPPGGDQDRTITPCGEPIPSYQGTIILHADEHRSVGVPLAAP